MTRTVPEWIGSSPDSAIPPRVKLRLFEKAGGKCECCGRKLYPGDKYQFDHIIAIINGGENREKNLQVLCDWCHKSKTKQDVKSKSKTAKVKAKHLGIKRPKHKWAKRGFNQYQSNAVDINEDRT